MLQFEELKRELEEQEKALQDLGGRSGAGKTPGRSGHVGAQVRRARLLGQYGASPEGYPAHGRFEG